MLKRVYSRTECREPGALAFPSERAWHCPVTIVDLGRGGAGLQALASELPYLPAAGTPIILQRLDGSLVACTVAWRRRAEEYVRLGLRFETGSQQVGVSPFMGGSM